MAHRTGDARTVAATARIVVIADYAFTTTAVIAQPVTGVLLALSVGYPLGEGWDRRLYFALSADRSVLVAGVGCSRR